MTNQTVFDWRRHLRVHPAAELFPLMAEAELKELAEDIRANGVIEPIILFVEADERKVLLDGRNRLDALALAGLLKINGEGNLELADTAGRTPRLHYWLERDRDPYALALSYNIRRRHLSGEQKRDLIEALLKAQPEKSDRAIASTVKADHKTVGKVRAEKEARGEIPHVEKRKDTKGRKQPAKKRTRPAKVEPEPKPGSVEYERDRAECIALNQKAIAAEQEPAEHKAVAAKDTALNEFDGHVLRLLQMIDKAKPERFTKTGVSAANLMQLGCFLNEVAAAARDGTAASADAMKAKLAALDTKSVH